MKASRRIAHYNKDDTAAAWLMLAPFLIFFVLFVLYPIVLNIYYSFTNYNLNTASWVGLKNYQRLWKDKAFVAALKNTSSTVTPIPSAPRWKPSCPPTPP